MTATVAQGLCVSLTPEKQAALAEQTNAVLLKLIQTNFKTQYASQTSSLTEFRDAVSAHGGPEIGSETLIQDFRTCVPLSDYETYKPFIDRFDSQPCKESDVENLFAPGLPAFLAMSSATSAAKPKLLAKYTAVQRTTEMRTIPEHNGQGLVAVVASCGYRGMVEVEREPGHVVHKIPLTTVSATSMRRAHGWHVDDDESRMPIIAPGYVAPWAAMMIGHHLSSLRIHALFFLACRDVGTFAVAFSTFFLDLIQHMDDQWDIFLECIRDGTIPDLEGIEHVRTYLQSHLPPNPDRAAELRDIGRPFSCEEWAVKVWPKLNALVAICSGPFATVLPKVKSILGPNVRLVCPRYAASEGNIGLPYRGDNDTFIVASDGGVLEFLDVTRDETHENISQYWEVKPGGLYEVIMTTQDGLWRYRLGDVVQIIGFDIETGKAVFHYSGRRSLTLRFPHTQITDGQLLEAVRAINSKDVLSIQEFTTVVDSRKTPPTLGLFVEPAGSPGPNARLASQKLFNGLVSTNAEHAHALEYGQIRLPTIRLLKAGTFAEYRRLKGEKMQNAGGAQIKLPVILLDPAMQEWISEWVAEEL